MTDTGFRCDVVVRYATAAAVDLSGVRMLEGITTTYEHRSNVVGGSLINAVMIGWIDHLLDRV